MAITRDLNQRAYVRCAPTQFACLPEHPVKIRYCRRHWYLSTPRRRAAIICVTGTCSMRYAGGVGSIRCWCWIYTSVVLDLYIAGACLPHFCVERRLLSAAVPAPPDHVSPSSDPLSSPQSGG